MYGISCFDYLTNTDSMFNIFVLAPAYILNNEELFENPDYKKLYDKCLEANISALDINKTLSEQECDILRKSFEIVARTTWHNEDVMPVTREEVDMLLAKCKSNWEMQEKATDD